MVHSCRQLHHGRLPRLWQWPIQIGSNRPPRICGRMAKLVLQRSPLRPSFLRGACLRFGLVPSLLVPGISRTCAVTLLHDWGLDGLSFPRLGFITCIRRACHSYQFERFSSMVCILTDLFDFGHEQLVECSSDQRSGQEMLIRSNLQHDARPRCQKLTCPQPGTQLAGLCGWRVVLPIAGSGAGPRCPQMHTKSTINMKQI